MRILLLGEYSNVHATLAEGLRLLGHEVTLASNGDFWKDYPRDIDLTRKPGKWGGIRLLGKLWSNASKLKGYDVVQLINPLFVELKAERTFKIYDWLRRNNRKMFLGAFGMDYYWVHENITRKPLRYSDFNIGETIRQTPDALKEQRDWLGTAKERLNRTIADDCDGIIAGLYEYWACYHPLFPGKTSFIPYPIKPKQGLSIDTTMPHRPVRIFVGISRGRSEYKGTDIMLAAAQAVQARHPEKVELKIAEGVPFDEYVEMMNQSDCILDQLYSYTPSMNALEAMSRGIICVGGGEPENYEILREDTLRPIVNVQPDYESVVRELENLVLNPAQIPELKRQSIEYIQRYHDYKRVAEQYVSFYLNHG
ncbi:MAG: glycosyltransferase family 4 protein [Prevotella sp.]|nr:glycosyltransferase family 4 protein [Prevotella sp.]